jgi:hypothetical protein
VRVEEAAFGLADDGGRAEGFVLADKPGLYRLFVTEKGSKAQTPALLYEVGAAR